MNKSACILSLLTILTVIFPISAQTGWIKSYGGSADDYGYSVQQTSDVGYIVAGWTESFGAGLADAWLLKTDENGDTLWTRTWGGPDYDRFSSVVQTSDGGYILAGQKDGSYQHDKGDLWLLKTDSRGDTLWTKTYGDTAGDEGICVLQTEDGGYVIAGTRDISMTGCPAGDIWLLKTDSNGDTLWTRTFGKTVDVIDTLQLSYHVEQTSDGGFVISGQWTSNFCLLRTNETGDLLWLVRMKPYAYSSQAFWIEETNNGDFVAVGFAAKNDALDADVYLLRFDSAGDSLWSKSYGDLKTNMGYSLCEASGGGWVITGVRGYNIADWGGDLWILRTDEDGDTLWSRTYGGSGTDWGYSVQTTLDGGYIVSGITESSGAGGKDLWLLKTDSLGNTAIEEPPAITSASDWEITSIGQTVTLRYSNQPEGFRAEVFDASGRKVEEINAPGQSGTLSWGKKQSPGVYFIKVNSDNDSRIQKVIIVR